MPRTADPPQNGARVIARGIRGNRKRTNPAATSASRVRLVRDKTPAERIAGHTRPPRYARQRTTHPGQGRPVSDLAPAGRNILGGGPVGMRLQAEVLNTIVHIIFTTCGRNANRLLRLPQPRTISPGSPPGLYPSCLTASGSELFELSLAVFLVLARACYHQPDS